MATSSEPDALQCLRQAIAANTPPVLTTTADHAAPDNLEPNLARATHLQFNHAGHQVFPLESPTRFESSGKAVDLRSVYFAWIKKDAAIAEYLSSTRQLNEELSSEGGAGASVQNLVFAEKLDLITWLESASDESEYIKPLDGDAAAREALGAAGLAAGVTGGIAVVPSAAAGARSAKAIDPRLQEIYNGERKMGDRNTVLRGIKPTDFSHIRKHAEVFLGRNRNRQGAKASPTAAAAVAPAAAPVVPQNQALVQNRTKPGRRPEPIILLSPSASSLLRMSNIKSFLDNGVYAPADSTAMNANILHITRLLPSIDPVKPMRFVLVDTPDQFKPDYWSRVVAVFTTGQTWQFKSYKWQSPPDLFSHVLGIYVGWRAEDVPSTVRGWGRGVMTTQIDKYNPHQGTQGRWRDREVVEGIWAAIEESMRNKGWSKDGMAAPR